MKAWRNVKGGSKRPRGHMNRNAYFAAGSGLLLGLLAKIGIKREKTLLEKAQETIEANIAMAKAAMDLTSVTDVVAKEPAHG